MGIKKHLGIHSPSKPQKILVIAPTYAQTQLFAFLMGWDLNTEYYVALTPEHLMGIRLENYEVWWLDRQWPCSTHEEVEHMEYMKALAKSRGADLHRWWT